MDQKMDQSSIRKENLNILLQYVQYFLAFRTPCNRNVQTCSMLIWYILSSCIFPIEPECLTKWLSGRLGPGGLLGLTCWEKVSFL